MATFVLAACAGAPPPSTTPKGEWRFLIDPRIGFTQTAQPAVERKLDAAWRYFVADDYVEARRRLGDLHARNPEYLPVALAEAAVEIRQGQLDSALAIVQRVENRQPDYTAAMVYEGEIAAAQHRTRRAFEIYRALSLRPGAPPTVAERLNALQRQLFDELFAAAQTAPSDEAIQLLREALTLNAGAMNARVLLANKLIEKKSSDEARQVLDPVINSGNVDKPEVQEALAEIEVGRGQYQQAMARYDRLSRTTHDPRYTRRLEEIKEAWNAANMPLQYQRAIESDSIDRADFAVLIYWTLTSVRFGQNLGTPPIALDIEGVPGREEIIRAMAIGLYDVDPVTQRVSPNRPISAAALARLAARILTLRGASCARVPQERILEACGITDPSVNVPPDGPVNGRTAAALLEQIERVLPH